MPRCGATVYPNERWGAFHPNQCKFKAVVERDGKSFCAIHDPERVEKKHVERQKKWNAEWDADKEKYRREAAMRIACEDVSTEILETVKVKDLLLLKDLIETGKEAK